MAKKINVQGIVSAVTGGLTGGASVYKNNSQIANTSGIESSINDIADTELNYGDYDSLMSDYNSFTPANTSVNWKSIRGGNYGDMIMNTAFSSINAAANGAQSTGSPYGAFAGLGPLIGGIGGIFSGNAKAKETADKLNIMAKDANETYVQNFSNNASNIKNEMFNRAALNMKAFGGNISPFVKSRLLSSSFKMKPRKMKYGGFGHYYAYGGDMSGEWTNGVTEINAGGTHEMNEYGGVPIGLDMNGTPNLVEEGEVVFNDYVYSNRLKPTEKQLDSVKINTKYKGKTYAEIAKDLQKESANRPLDPISKNTLVDSMSKLTAIQEESRQYEMLKQLVEQLQQMTPEEQMGLMQNIPMESMNQVGQNAPISSIPFGSQEEFTPDNQRAYRGIQEEMNEGMLAPEEQMALGGFVNMGADGLPLRRYIPDASGYSSRFFTNGNPAENAYLRALGLLTEDGYNKNLPGFNAKMDFATRLYRYYLYKNKVDGTISDSQSKELTDYAIKYWNKYGSDDWGMPYLGDEELSDEDFEREYKLYQELGEDEYFRRKQEEQEAEYDRRQKEAEELDRQEAAKQNNGNEVSSNAEDNYFDYQDNTQDDATDIQSKEYQNNENDKETKEERKARRKAEREAKQREKEYVKKREKEAKERERINKQREKERIENQRKEERERKNEERKAEREKDRNRRIQERNERNRERELERERGNNERKKQEEEKRSKQNDNVKQDKDNKVNSSIATEENALDDAEIKRYSFVDSTIRALARGNWFDEIQQRDINDIQNEDINTNYILPEVEKAVYTPENGLQFTDEIFKPKLLNEELLRDRLEKLLDGKDVKGLPYTDKFKYFNNGKYDDDYENFVKNFKFGEASGKYGAEIYNILSKIYKERTGKDLTTDEAKNLGLDKKFGIFHDIWAEAMKYNPETNPIMSTPELSEDIDFDYDAELQNTIDSIKNEQIANPKVKAKFIKEKQDNIYPGMNGMQFAPVFGSALGAMSSLFEQPDYTAADYIARGRRGIRDVRGRAIGNYLTYNPYDINYASGKINQLGLNSQRAINNTAANAGQSIYGTLLQNANTVGQIGDIRTKAREYNDQQRSAIANFNRATDMQNANWTMQADSTNANLDIQRANMLQQEGALRSSIDDALSSRRSESMSNLFNNLGNLGTTKYNADRAQWLFDMGFIPNTTMGTNTKVKKDACGGKIRRKKKGLLK